MKEADVSFNESKGTPQTRKLEESGLVV